jgi:hypothetical protein
VRPLAGVALLGVTLASAGCSAVFVQPVRTVKRQRVSAGCSESIVLPVLDTIATGLLTVRAGYGLVAPDSAYQNATLSRPVNVGTSTLLAVAFAVSAGYGFSKTGECSELRAVEAFDAPRAEPEAPPAPAVRRRAGAPAPQETDDE